MPRATACDSMPHHAQCVRHDATTYFTDDGQVGQALYSGTFCSLNFVPLALTQCLPFIAITKNSAFLILLVFLCQ